MYGRRRPVDPNVRNKHHDRGGDTPLAEGPIWLPTVPATQTSFDNINPAMATYRNHAFILTTRAIGAEPEEQVYVTTNASGAWTTRLLSAHGPGASYGAQWTAIAIDPSINRLYAAWVRPSATPLGPASLWVLTSDDNGNTWHGPTTIASGQISEPPDIVAAHGRAYVAFTAAPDKRTASCNDTTSRTSDVMLATFAGGHWSSPRNLTSCATGAKALSFDGPKLALDESSGHLYLVSDSEESNLWYMDNAAGTWSAPQRQSARRPLLYTRVPRRGRPHHHAVRGPGHGCAALGDAALERAGPHAWLRRGLL